MINNSLRGNELGYKTTFSQRFEEFGRASRCREQNTHPGLRLQHLNIDNNSLNSYHTTERIR